SIATAQTSASTGRINGTIFVADSQGPSYVPGAKVMLSGARSVEQQADEQGRFTFDQLAPGAYAITAESPGLQAGQSVTVEVGKIANVTLELKPLAVQTEITVTASPTLVKGEIPAQTISANTVRDTPNQNERTESVLALVPGVVRGPDGRINMKGARNTQ